MGGNGLYTRGSMAHSLEELGRLEDQILNVGAEPLIVFARGDI
jgi:hypothetical protein